MQLDLPKPSRAGWLFATLVGCGLAGLGGIMLRNHGVAALEDALTIAVLGVGMFMLGMPVAVLLNREPPSSLLVVDGDIVLRTARGGEVALPASSIVDVTAAPPPGQSDGLVLALHKRDGGLIELAPMQDEEQARRFTEPLREALAAADRSTQDDLPGAARLQRHSGIVVANEGPDLTLTWSASVAWTRWLVLLPLIGFWLITYAFHLHDGGLGTLLSMAFIGTLVAAYLIFTLVNVGVVQRVRFSVSELHVERLRNNRVIKSQKLALTNVAAVDYSVRTHTVGGGLSIRSGRQAMAKENAHRAAASQLIGDAPEDIGASLGMAKAILAAATAGIEVPCGALPLATKLALDLALGEEVAKRTLQSADRL